ATIGADAELAAAIGAPGPDAAVVAQRQAVAAAGRDGDHAVQAFQADGQGVPLDGVRVDRPVSELAAVVGAPGPDVPLVIQGQAVDRPGPDADDGRQAVHAPRHARVQGGAAAEL